MFSMATLVLAGFLGQAAAQLPYPVDLLQALRAGRDSASFSSSDEAQAPLLSVDNAIRAGTVSGPADLPNLSTRLEVIGNGTDLFCGEPGDAYKSGYAHFTNSNGEEDKHMFWVLYEARHDPENAPIVMTLGGGPGASGMLFPFSGAGPCTIVKDQEGRGTAVPAAHSWTEYVNLLAIDHPVGVGYGYGESIRRTSASAAWDVDDFLQEFWKEYPHLAANKFMISSGSYGGTFVPHIVDAVRTRNHAVDAHTLDRTRKMPDSIMLTNTWSDVFTHYRWLAHSNCGSDEANAFWNATGCAIFTDSLPSCMDSLQYALENSTESSRLDAFQTCFDLMGSAWEGSDRDPYDYNRQCPPGGCDISSDLQAVEDVLNGSALKEAFGIPVSRKFKVLDVDGVGARFILSGDFIQSTYRLLAPAIANDGLRLLVHNGMRDGVAPWRSTYAWMRLIQTPHQSEFRSAPELEYPGVGSIQKAGDGAGDFTFIKVRNGGHMIIQSQPDLIQHLMVRFLNNEAFF